MPAHTRGGLLNAAALARGLRLAGDSFEPSSPSIIVWICGVSKRGRSAVPVKERGGETGVPAAATRQGQALQIAA